MNNLQMFIIILVSWMSYVCALGRLFCVSCKMCLLEVFFFSFFFACVICATVIECGSKKALRKTQGWLPGGFAESRGNFPHRRPSSVVCQPPLAPLAAIVPTAVNHAAYESEEQSIALLMNPNSSQLFSVGIHWHIWCFQLGTWMASDRTSQRQAEINHNKNHAGQKKSLPVFPYNPFAAKKNNCK